MTPIDFWYSIGSTYSYLTVMRITELCAARGVTATWHPFQVRDIMMEIGNRPFAGKPVKMAYMWRDMERRAAMYGMPIAVPAPYPLTEMDLANRLAVLGQREGWQEACTTESCRKWFLHGVEPGLEPGLSETLAAIGRDPAETLAKANDDAMVQTLNDATQRARELGIFGSPTFVVEGELFWGDDRLEDAISWSLNGAVKRD